jgi:hypothetical protein
MGEYHKQSNRYLGSGGLKIFRDESPARYKAAKDGLLEPFDSVAFAQGRGAHTLILEGDQVYADTYHIGGPRNKKGVPFGRDTQAFKDWCESEGHDPEFVMTLADHELNRNLRSGCMRNPDIAALLMEGVAEKVLRMPFHGVSCQIRPDWTSPTHGNCNLKTTRDLNWFGYDATKKFNYIAGESFYRSVMREAVPEMPEFPCCFIAVEKKVPYRAAIFEIDPYNLDQEKENNCEAIDSLIQCRETGIWPTNFEGLNVI